MSEDIGAFTAIASKYRVLDKPTERDLIRRSQQDPPDQEALDLLVKHNISLVISIAKKYIKQGVSFSDLIQEGQIGLMTAIKKFNLETGGALSTYATWWIRQSITRSIANDGRLIRIPVNVHNEIRLVKKCYREFLERYEGEIPSADELTLLVKKAKQLEKDKADKDRAKGGTKKYISKLPDTITKEYIADLHRLLDTPTSLNATSSENDNIAMEDIVCFDEDPLPEEQLEVSMNKEYVRGLLDLLDHDEKQFIMIRFGFIDLKERTKKQMSSFFGKMSETEIKNKEDQILAKLLDLANKNKVNL